VGGISGQRFVFGRRDAARVGARRRAHRTRRCPFREGACGAGPRRAGRRRPSGTRGCEDGNASRRAHGTERRLSPAESPAGPRGSRRRSRGGCERLAGTRKTATDRARVSRAAAGHRDLLPPGGDEERHALRSSRYDMTLGFATARPPHPGAATRPEIARGQRCRRFFAARNARRAGRENGDKIKDAPARSRSSRGFGFV
jgi:hypothetical protein